MQTQACKDSSLTVLGNLTNSHSPHSVSPSAQTPSSNKNEYHSSPTKGQPPQKNLELENLELKTQIELLKTALLEICKEKQLQLPSLAPIFQSDVVLQENSGVKTQKQDLRASPFQVNSLKQHSTPLVTRQGPRLSPKKNQQPKQTQKDAQLFQNENGSQISQINQHSSPIKSLQRRNRANRTQAKPTIQIRHEDEPQVQVEQSPHFNEELPLQMNVLAKKSVLGLDDTLFLDKTIELAVRQNCDVDNQIPKFSDDHLPSEIVFSREDDMRDASQIQIKYAKMLEELDNDSIDDIGMTINPENCFSRQETGTKENREEFCYPMQMNSVTAGSSKSPILKGKHQKNSSSQFEQKAFYENELHTLKTELQQFAQEEEKLLQMLAPLPPDLNCSAAPSDKVNFHTFEPTQKVLGEQRSKMLDSIVTDSKLDESDVKQDQEAANEIDRNGAQPLTLIQTDLNDYQAIQRNLEEAVGNFMADEDIDDPYRMVIKPIKINSPVERLLCEYTTEVPTIQRGKSKASVFERESHLQNTVSPKRKSSIVSIDCTSEMTLVTQRNVYQCKSPFYEEKNNHQTSVNMISSPRGSVLSRGDGPSTKAKMASAKSNRSKGKMAAVKSQKGGNFKPVLNKNPSQYMSNLLDKMASTSSMRYLSPITHLLKNQEAGDCKSPEQPLSTKASQIDILAQQQHSLASGLKQQQEPSEDEEYISLRIVQSNQQSVIVPEAVSEFVSDTYSPVKDEDSLYFGLYSVQKSEELKQQRLDSIKKAEELLQLYLNDKLSTKRPVFSSSQVTKSQEPVYTSEEVQQVVIEVVNDLPAKQQEKMTKCFSNQRFSQGEIEPQPEQSMIRRVSMPLDVLTPYKAEDDYDCKSKVTNFGEFSAAHHMDYEVINLQITPDRQGSNNKKIQMYGKELTPFEEQREERIDPDLVDIQKDNYQSFDILALNKLHQESSSSECPSISEQKPEFSQTALLDQIISQFNQDYEYIPHPFQETDYLQPQIISSRRKSVENKMSCKQTHQVMSNPSKRKSMQNKKMASIMKDSDSTKEDSYLKPSSSSCEKMNLKCIESNKFATTLSSSEFKMIGAQSKQKVAGDTMANPAFSDAEYLYSVRSKSVVKRREELLRKKQDESKTKLDAKYKKIEKLQQTRNMFRVPSSSKYTTSAVTQPDMIPKKATVDQNAQVYNSNKKQVQPRDEYQSSTKKKDVGISNSSSVVEVNNKTILPIRQEKRLQAKRDSISSLNQVKQSTQVITSSTHQITQLQTTPLSRSPISVQPQSKAAKISSQCTSYRNKEDQTTQSTKRQESSANRQQQLFQKHQECSSRERKNSKTPTCTLLYKQKLQSQHGLKQNIVNKNLRLNKSRESHAYKDIQNNSNQKSLHSTLDYSVNQSQSFVDGKQLSQAKKEPVQKEIVHTQTKAANSSRSMIKPPTAVPSSYTTACLQQPAIVHAEKPVILRSEKECGNCIRLKSKGLSTDFCLEHYERSPRYIDD